MWSLAHTPQTRGARPRRDLSMGSTCICLAGLCSMQCLELRAETASRPEHMWFAADVPIGIHLSHILRHLSNRQLPVCPALPQSILGPLCHYACALLYERGFSRQSTSDSEALAGTLDLHRFCCKIEEMLCTQAFGAKRKFAICFVGHMCFCRHASSPPFCTCFCTCLLRVITFPILCPVKRLHRVFPRRINTAQPTACLERVYIHSNSANSVSKVAQVRMAQIASVAFSAYKLECSNLRGPRPWTHLCHTCSQPRAVQLSRDGLVACVKHIRLSRRRGKA